MSTRAGDGSGAGGSVAGGAGGTASGSTATGGGGAAAGSAGSAAGNTGAGTGGVPSGGCSADDEFSDTASGKCYRRNTETLNWNDAEAACVTWGGHLAGVATTAENELVVTALREAGVQELVWVGANDLTTEGTWQFANGEAYAYTTGQPPWGEGKPNDFNMAEDCASVDTMTAEGLWNDVSCEDLLPSLCEK